MAAVSLHDFQRLQEQLKSVADPVAFLVNLFAHAPVGFAVWTADGHPLLTNDAFMELFRVEPPPEYNVLQDDILAANGMLALFQRAFAGETVHVPTFWYDPRDLKIVHVTKGRRVALSMTIFPLFKARRDRIRGRDLQGRDRGHARARSTPGAKRQPGAHGAGAHHPASERQPRPRGVQLLGGARPSRAAAEHEHLRRGSAARSTGTSWIPMASASWSESRQARC